MYAGAVRACDNQAKDLSKSQDAAKTSAFDTIVGRSIALQKALWDVRKVAKTEATVLITGESGTGKEMIAQAIHESSRRAGRPFLKVNCAAIAPTLIASELFGYEKGAFTGAIQRRIGRFEAANGGTIFLDEIGDIPHETQIALLRVLEERNFERVGGTAVVPVDVRVLAATNRDVVSAVKKGEFRCDLYYRLNVFPIHLPPLRDRPGDVLLLARYFMERFASSNGKFFEDIESTTIERLQAHDWPGNIRELRNVIERAVILCNKRTLSIDEEWLQPCKIIIRNTGLGEYMSSVEREVIESALRESGGRIAGTSGAACILNMPRTTLESKIRVLGIDKYKFKSPELR